MTIIKLALLHVCFSTIEVGSTSNMPTFPSHRYRRVNEQFNTLGDRIGATYRRHLLNHPFLLFGLPFISLMVAASFLLTPATALRYERHDRKNRTLTHSEAMELGLKGGANGEGSLSYNPRRRVVTRDGNSERDEYYVRNCLAKISISLTMNVEINGKRS